MSENRKIAKRTGLISLLTLGSRLLGLARDMTIAFVFGTGLAADAFFVANRIPNLFRRLFAEGAMTVSFVPIFSQALNRSKEEAKETADTLFTLAVVVLALFCVVGVIFSPLIVKLTAYGFTHDPEKFTLTVYLNRILFPYLLLVSVAAVGMGILNSLKRFAAPAAGPILMNVGVILGALVFSKWFNPSALGLAIGVLVGGILQVLIQVPQLKKLGYLPRWRWNLKHPAVNRMGKMMLPSAYGAAVYQFNVVATTLLASFLASGSVSYLWYSNRIMEFPVGIFAIALTTAILPSLSDFAARQEMEKLKETFNYGLRLIFFITIPAAFGLFILSGPIVHILLERGSFTAASAQATASALQYFALGLPFIAGVRITSNAFYSLQDAKAPVRAANWSVVFNILVALVLLKPLAHNGLALAVSLASVFNFGLQTVYFRRKVGLIGLRRVFASLKKQLLASLGMAVVLTGLLSLWQERLLQSAPWVAVFWLMAAIALGMGVYFALVAIFKSEELNELWDMIRTRG